MIAPSRHELEAYLDDGTPLNVLSAEVTLDRSWSPHAQARLVIDLPENVASLDPRTKRRVRLRAVQSYGDSDPLSALSTAYAGLTLANLSALFAGQTLASVSAGRFHPYVTPAPSGTARRFDLGLRSVQTDTAGQTATLELASDEALLQDITLVEEPYWIPLAPNQFAIAAAVLQRIGAQLSTAAGITPLEATPTWSRGTSAFDYIRTIMQAVDQALWCDENRRWHTISGRINHSFLDLYTAFVLSGAANVTDDRQSIDRDSEWADAVVVTYEWNNTSGLTQTREDVAFRDDVAFVDGYSKVRTLTIKQEYPGPGVARRLLQNSVREGRRQQLTALSDYSVLVGQLVDTDAADDEGRVISAVSWSFPNGLMTVTTQPE